MYRITVCNAWVSCSHGSAHYACTSLHATVCVQVIATLYSICVYSIVSLLYCISCLLRGAAQAF